MWNIIVLLVQHAIKYIFFHNFSQQLKKHQKPNQEDQSCFFFQQNSANPVIRYFAHNKKRPPSTNNRKIPRQKKRKSLWNNHRCLIMPSIAKNNKSLRIRTCYCFQKFCNFAFKKCCFYKKWMSFTCIFQLRSSIFIFLLVDHALLGQVIETVNVTDEFECHRKCIQNNTCKSFNVHPPRSNPIKKTCEMNNQTRQMKPKHYKKKIGSSYHGPVEVSLIRFLNSLPSCCFFSKVVIIRSLYFT